MARANQSASMLVDSASDAYYEGVPGQMPGGPTFFASAMFVLAGIGTGSDQLVVGNVPVGFTAGWAIVVRNVGDVPTLAVVISTDGGVHEVTFPLPQSLGKIVLVHVSVFAGVLDVVVNGNAAIVGSALPGAALASGGAPTIGNTNDGSTPAAQLGIIGAGYLAFPGNAVVAEQHMQACRGIYDFADLFFGAGPSWTHYYTVRQGLVVPGAQASFSGGFIAGLPLGAPEWAPSRESVAAIPDIQPRVPLTRIGASTTGGTVLVLDNPIWAPVAETPGGGGGGGGYDTIEDEGVALAQETVLDFVGAGVTATPGAGKTVVTIPGGGGGGGLLLTSVKTVDYAGSVGELVRVEAEDAGGTLIDIDIPDNPGLAVGDRFGVSVESWSGARNPANIRQFRLQQGALSIFDPNSLPPSGSMWTNAFIAIWQVTGFIALPGGNTAIWSLYDTNDAKIASLIGKLTGRVDTSDDTPAKLFEFEVSAANGASPREMDLTVTARRGDNVAQFRIQASYTHDAALTQNNFNKYIADIPGVLTGVDVDTTLVGSVVTVRAIGLIGGAAINWGVDATIRKVT